MKMKWTKNKSGYSVAYHGDAIISVAAIAGGGYRVTRNGIEIAGPSCIGAPAGFTTVDAAQRWADEYLSHANA